jgi:hypothetical protein
LDSAFFISCFKTKIIRVNISGDTKFGNFQNGCLTFTGRRPKRLRDGVINLAPVLTSQPISISHLAALWRNLCAQFSLADAYSCVLAAILEFTDVMEILATDV